MDAEIAEYSGMIDSLLGKVGEHVKGLSPQALNWFPLERGTNSVGALAAHMCGLVRWWVLQGLSGRSVGRDRDSEFTVVVNSNRYIKFWGRAVDLSVLICQTQMFVCDALKKLDSVALDDTCLVNSLGPHTKRWALIHTIDELSQHLGHMELTIQLWNENPEFRCV